MAVSSQVPEYISSSLAGNIRSLLAQISKLVTDSAERVKRSSVEAADEQLCDIKSFVEKNRNCLAYGKFGHWSPNVHGFFVLLRNLQRVSIA